jgi:hypothetical protein
LIAHAEAYPPFCRHRWTAVNDSRPLFFSFADFILEHPTPLAEDGEAQIHHYSARRSLPAKNVLLAIEDA